jgi:hypothetical protein
MADAKRFLLTSSEISEREQPFSHPWNPKSQLIGVQLSRAYHRGGNRLCTTPTNPKKSGFISFRVAALLKSTAKK